MFSSQKASTPPSAPTSPVVPTSHVYISQPGIPVLGGIWIPPPSSIPGVPPGLEYLSQVDNIVVEQLIELFEVMLGVETRNKKYSLKNGNGQQVYFAGEESTCLMRYCCGPGRAFSIGIVDNFRREAGRTKVAAV